MPLGVSEKKTYLQIGWGKLRLKAAVMAEGVVERETQKGEKSLAYEYNFIEGKITKIYYKDSKEYGNSFEVTIDDGKEKYSVSFKEDSRYCQDFLSKLPNIAFSKTVKITPYQMTDNKSGKEKRGVSIQQDGVKIQSYFSELVDEKWNHKHGFPEPASKNMSETELKIYFLLVKDFLTKYACKYIIPTLQEASYSAELTHEPEADPIPDAAGTDDDLPF